METAAPLGELVSNLRSIARNGFSYAETIKLGKAAGWNLEADEPELGFVRFDADLVTGQGPKRSVVVEFEEFGRRPMAFTALFFFEDYKNGRGAFDRAYNAILYELVEAIGEPTRFGNYACPHRGGWLYYYAWWSLNDSTFAVVQDEFDILFGMDVSLWVFPANEAFRMPVHF